MNVETSTLEDLQKVILSNPYGKAPRTDYRTPAFEDYLEICEHYGKHAVLEIKSDMSVEQLEKLVAVIKDYSMLSNTIFISFHAEVLVRLRGLLPDQPIQLLTGGYTPATLEFLLKHNFALDIAYSSLSEENIKELKARNIEINIWTCDSKADAEKYIGFGVDYITSNILE